jgi:hypothetical protein
VVTSILPQRLLSLHPCAGMQRLTNSITFLPCGIQSFTDLVSEVNANSKSISLLIRRTAFNPRVVFCIEGRVHSRFRTLFSRLLAVFHKIVAILRRKHSKYRPKSSLLSKPEGNFSLSSSKCPCFYRNCSKGTHFERGGDVNLRSAHSNVTSQKR